jgi:hypothetical protein
LKYKRIERERERERALCSFKGEKWRYLYIDNIVFATNVERSTDKEIY